MTIWLVFLQMTIFFRQSIKKVPTFKIYKDGENNVKHFHFVLVTSY